MADIVIDGVTKNFGNFTALARVDPSRVAEGARETHPPGEVCQAALVPVTRHGHSQWGRQR